MKVLILTCNTGQGHNSTAAAIREVLDKQGVECDIADTIAFMSDLGSKIVDRSFTELYRRMPTVWNKGYSNASKKNGILNGAEHLTFVMLPAARRLCRYVEENNYSHIVCVHVLSAVMVTVMKRKCTHSINTCFLATDYACYPYVEKTDVDLYFLPHEDVSKLYIDRGIPKEKIAITGIPVKKAFLQDLSDKTLARRALGLSESSKIVFIMAGSMGCGPIRDLTAAICEQLKDDLCLLVSCGTNASLLRELQKIGDQRILPFRYSDKIPEIMSAADLFVTKPGGISITEAAIMGLPTLLIDMVGGCETSNYDFFVAHGFAFGAKGVDDAASLCAELFANRELLSAQSNRVRSVFHRSSAEEICRIIC